VGTGRRHLSTITAVFSCSWIILGRKTSDPRPLDINWFSHSRSGSLLLAGKFLRIILVTAYIVLRWEVRRSHH